MPKKSPKLTNIVIHDKHAFQNLYLGNSGLLMSLEISKHFWGIMNTCVSSVVICTHYVATSKDIMPS